MIFNKPVMIGGADIILLGAPDMPMPGNESKIF